MRSRHWLAVAFVVAVIIITGGPVRAQSYPTRGLQLIVAYSPGGTGDIVARTIADKLATALGQSVIVENRAGASGAIGACGDDRDA